MRAYYSTFTVNTTVTLYLKAGSIIFLIKNVINIAVNVKGSIFADLKLINNRGREPQN